MRTIYFAHDQQESPEGRRQLLELTGYVVHLYKSHRELTAAFKSGLPDLVLVDALLEGKNGFETTQELNQRFPERNFAIVLCSQVYRLRPFRDEAVRMGAQDYLLLPMAPDEFLRRVNESIISFQLAAKTKTHPARV